MIQVDTYTTTDRINISSQMVLKIGAVSSKDECAYLGEIEIGGFKKDCYHCFSTTVFVDRERNNLSIAGLSNAVENSRKKLESVLDLKLIELKSHKY